jgi:hypothetical protein
VFSCRFSIVLSDIVEHDKSGSGCWVGSRHRDCQTVTELYLLLKGIRPASALSYWNGSMKRVDVQRSCSSCVGKYSIRAPSHPTKQWNCVWNSGTTRLSCCGSECSFELIPLHEGPGKLLMIGVRDFADLRPKNRQICVHWPFFCGLEGPKSHKYSVHFRGLIEVKD